MITRTDPVIYPVVLKALGVAIGTLAHQAAEGIVVVLLLHRTAGTGYDAVVSQMVLQVEMVHGRTATKRDVSAIDQDLFQYVVLVYHVAAVVRRDRRGYRRGLVADSQLLATGTIDIRGTPAVGVCDTRRQI